MLTWLGVLEHRSKAAPHKAGPLILYALDLRQWRSDDRLDALQGRRHRKRHSVVCGPERRFPQHPRDQKEHCGKDGHTSCRGKKGKPKSSAPPDKNYEQAEKQKQRPGCDGRKRLKKSCGASLAVGLTGGGTERGQFRQDGNCVGHKASALFGQSLRLVRHMARRLLHTCVKLWQVAN